MEQKSNNNPLDLQMLQESVNGDTSAPSRNIRILSRCRW